MVSLRLSNIYWLLDFIIDTIKLCQYYGRLSRLKWMNLGLGYQERFYKLYRVENTKNINISLLKQIGPFVWEILEVA